MGYFSPWIHSLNVHGGSGTAAGVVNTKEKKYLLSSGETEMNPTEKCPWCPLLGGDIELEKASPQR